VRKLSAILLILVFAGSQYARQISYFQCKLANTFKATSYQCDCEKQPGFDKKAPNQSPVPLPHTHHFPDDYFSVICTEAGVCRYSYILTIALYPRAENLHEGNYPGPWRPPNT